MNIKRIFLGGVLTTLIAFSAFAEVKSKNITFFKPVTVNGVNVRAGNYRVEFDSEKSELSIVKHGEIVAKATVHTETTPTKASGTRIETLHTDNGNLLIAITFDGKDERIVLASGEGSPSMK